MSEVSGKSATDQSSSVPTSTAGERFSLMIKKDSNNVWGWNGYVLDRKTNMRHPLIKTVVDYVVQDEIGYAHCAFDTKAELHAAACRKARSLAR